MLVFLQIKFLRVYGSYSMTMDVNRWVYLETDKPPGLGKEIESDKREKTSHLTAQESKHFINNTFLNKHI